MKYHPPVSVLVCVCAGVCCMQKDYRLTVLQMKTLTLPSPPTSPTRACIVKLCMLVSVFFLLARCTTISLCYVLLSVAVVGGYGFYYKSTFSSTGTSLAMQQNI